MKYPETLLVRDYENDEIYQVPVISGYRIDENDYLIASTGNDDEYYVFENVNGKFEQLEGDDINWFQDKVEELNKIYSDIPSVSLIKDGKKEEFRIEGKIIVEGKEYIISRSKINPSLIVPLRYSKEKIEIVSSIPELNSIFKFLGCDLDENIANDPKKSSIIKEDIFYYGKNYVISVNIQNNMPEVFFRENENLIREKNSEISERILLEHIGMNSDDIEDYDIEGIFEVSFDNFYILSPKSNKELIMVFKEDRDKLIPVNNRDIIEKVVKELETNHQKEEQLKADDILELIDQTGKRQEFKPVTIIKTDEGDFMILESLAENGILTAVKITKEGLSAVEDKILIRELISKLKEMI